MLEGEEKGIGKSGERIPRFFMSAFRLDNHFACRRHLDAY